MKSYNLTKCELEVMDVAWNRGEVTVQDVVDGIARDLAYTTVMTTLRILHTQRKVLARSKQGRAHVYTPLVTRDEVSQSVASELKQTLFGGSTKSLLLNLMESDDFSEDDVQELKAAIQALEKNS